MKFCFATMGCKVNQFETQALAQLAQQRGHTLCDGQADVCILNTCTVTASGTRKNIRELHRLRRSNPNAVIALCGCFAQTEPERAAALEGVTIVCGTADRARVIDLCEQAVQQRQSICTVQPIAAHGIFEPLPAGVLPGHTRALLKIQDGCDNYCSYCIIPYARGHVRSLPLRAAVAQAATLAAGGVKEIVVTGIEIASYGRDLTEPVSLADLTRALCDSVPDVRIRLGSLEPRIVTDSFCAQLSQLPNLALHFHLSLQSGCDLTLQRMRRRYTTTEYFSAVMRLRDAFPSCAITTDVITGFPGESAEEFAQTVAFLRRCAFASVHVFPYSERPGTPAASMPDSVPPAERSRRADCLRQLARTMEQTYLESFVGQCIPIVLEHPHHGTQAGHSRWHFAVQLEQPDGEPGNVCQVQVTKADSGVLYGKQI